MPMAARRRASLVDFRQPDRPGFVCLNRLVQRPYSKAVSLQEVAATPAWKWVARQRVPRHRSRGIRKKDGLLFRKAGVKMRTYVMVMVAVAVGAVGAYVALGGQSGDNTDQGMMGGGMMGGGMMGGGMMPMRGMMAQSMAESMSHDAMVATSDGGVVVWAGGKLMKYDSGLNLTKEIELKVDYEAMQQRMQKMMESMPMMRGGMMPMRQNMMRGSGGNTGGSSTTP
jgi:hypothetical protein